MRMLPVCLVSAALLVVPVGRGQTPAPPTQAEHASARYSGEVRSYEPGNRLEVDIGEKRSKSYDLTDKDKRFDIEAGLTRGSKVNITEMKDAAGRVTVSVRIRH